MPALFSKGPRRRRPGGLVRAGCFSKLFGQFAMKRMARAVELATGSQRHDYELHEASRNLCAPPDATFQHERKVAAEERIGDCSTHAMPRVWSQKLGCYVLAEPRRDKSRLGRRRARRLPVSIPDKSGRWWWVGDRTSGVRLVKIERWSWYEARVEADRLFPGQNAFVVEDRDCRA